MSFAIDFGLQRNLRLRISDARSKIGWVVGILRIIPMLRLRDFRIAVISQKGHERHSEERNGLG